MSSTRMQERPVDVADDVHHLRFARPLAALVDDGEGRVDALGQRAGAHDAADVGRDHHAVPAVERSLMSRTMTGAANRLSVGMSKKPWIWPA